MITRIARCRFRTGKAVRSALQPGRFTIKGAAPQGQKPEAARLLSATVVGQTAAKDGTIQLKGAQQLKVQFIYGHSMPGKLPTIP